MSPCRTWQGKCLRSRITIDSDTTHVGPSGGVWPAQVTRHLRHLSLGLSEWPTFPQPPGEPGGRLVTEGVQCHRKQTGTWHSTWAREHLSVESHTGACRGRGELSSSMTPCSRPGAEPLASAADRNPGLEAAQREGRGLPASGAGPGWPLPRGGQGLPPGPRSSRCLAERTHDTHRARKWVRKPLHTW